eukprot:IDg15078t1
MSYEIQRACCAVEASISEGIDSNLHLRSCLHLAHPKSILLDWRLHAMTAGKREIGHGRTRITLTRYSKPSFVSNHNVIEAGAYNMTEQGVAVPHASPVQETAESIRKLTESLPHIYENSKSFKKVYNLR